MTVDVSQLVALASDLSAAPVRVIAEMDPVVRVNGELLKNEWKGNAAATAGAHGKHYPNSITMDVERDALGIHAEVGPDSGMPQGEMGRGFEYGSINQPPHLDGNKAADTVEGPFVNAVLNAAAGAIL